MPPVCGSAIRKPLVVKLSGWSTQLSVHTTEPEPWQKRAALRGSEPQVGLTRNAPGSPELFVTLSALRFSNISKPRPHLFCQIQDGFVSPEKKIYTVWAFRATENFSHNPWLHLPCQNSSGLLWWGTEGILRTQHRNFCNVTFPNCVRDTVRWHLELLCPTNWAATHVPRPSTLAAWRSTVGNTPTAQRKVVLWYASMASDLKNQRDFRVFSSLASLEPQWSSLTTADCVSHSWKRGSLFEDMGKKRNCTSSAKSSDLQTCHNFCISRQGKME